jgi:DUF1680 family protein
LGRAIAWEELRTMWSRSIAGLGVVLVLAAGGSRARAPEAKVDYPVQPVPITDVTFSDSFWASRIETNRAVTIPFAFKQSEQTGRVKNFEIAAGLQQGAFCTRYPFDDSDVYKVIEGASYALAQHPDPELGKYVDGVIAKIAAAQEKDGYIYTARTIDPAKAPAMSGKERWTNEQESHELYNAGHLYEAAVAYYQATGRRNLLDVAVRNAALVMREFGPSARKLVPGHQEIEIGLVKLYRTTGDKRYLDQAKFFLDERGNASGHKLYGEYAQDHLPVVQQAEAVGHAVRAAYMYSGMADVAALTGDRAYIAAIDRLWDNVVSKKLYLTGGIGATGSWEGFGPAYELANASAYSETCASIANALWNYRMFLLHGDAKYIDVFERVIYNAVLSGVALSGDKFFYPNPLASFGQHERSPWFACACCPSNVPRFIPAIPGYSYAVGNGGIYVNLFVQGTAKVKLPSGEVTLEQATEYPWKGDVAIRVAPARPAAFTLRVRIPGWSRGEPLASDLYRYADKFAAAPSVKVNGRAVPLTLDKGYLSIARTWQANDRVEVSLPMPIRRVVAHPAVKADVGRVAIERGPIVYAAEWPDNGGHVNDLVLDDATVLTAVSRPDLLKGLTVVSGNATRYRYQQGRLVSSRETITLIPYYAWAHRGRGEMTVWLAGQPDKARPTPEPTIASTAKASASGGTGVQSLNDQFEPENSNDHSTGYFHWWPKKGTLEWVQYDFAQPASVSEVSVYWFDDTGQGECRVPASWRVLYRSGDNWVPVENSGEYGTARDRYNTVTFKPARTSALRLEIRLPEKFSAGIQEWRVR